MKPLVAIVGRPNVGKSTLFNKLIGERLIAALDMIEQSDFHDASFLLEFGRAPFDYASLRSG